MLKTTKHINKMYSYYLLSNIFNVQNAKIDSRHSTHSSSEIFDRQFNRH
jgi:hypothetical protein